MLPMPSHPILTRVDLLTVLLVGLVAIADGVVRHELRQAASGMSFASAVAVAEPAGASDE